MADAAPRKSATSAVAVSFNILSINDQQCFEMEEDDRQGSITDGETSEGLYSPMARSTSPAHTRAPFSENFRSSDTLRAVYASHLLPSRRVLVSPQLRMRFPQACPPFGPDLAQVSASLFQRGSSRCGVNFCRGNNQCLRGSGVKCRCLGVQLWPMRGVAFKSNGVTGRLNHEVSRGKGSQPWEEPCRRCVVINPTLDAEQYQALATM